MYHLVYLVRNLVNGKLYVGIHSTYKLDDGYLGSSKAIKDAVRKYGVVNFERTILHFCLSRQELYDWEKFIVDESFVTNPNTYNLKEGGRGGLPSFKHSVQTKHKQSVSKAKTAKKTCEFCKQKVDPQNYAQLHGKFCESNPNRVERKITRYTCSFCHTDCTRIDYYNNHEKYCIENPNREVRVLPTTTCEHCGKEVDTRNYSRFHGIRCKSNPNRVVFPGKTCEHCGREVDNKNYTRFHGSKCKLNPVAIGAA